MSQAWDRLRDRAKNALMLLREGRLGAPYRAAYDVLWSDRTVSLRHYRGSSEPEASPGLLGPILLVPPLMVTAEIYDIAPELSGVAALSGLGCAVYLADFGTPEALEGGMERTLDDHVLAIARAVEDIAARSGREVHLVGYSQGGMFAYQAAAYLKSAHIASVIALGAPVDIRRNLPVRVHDTLAEKMIGLARRAIDGPLEDLKGLPGTLSSRGFKLMAPRQEVKHFIQLLGLLHDRDALAALEPKRRFLGGEGFIAWPGPALRQFIDQFVVANRMKQGGFVIAGRTVSLADITRPICYFVGERDDLAWPEAVRAIEVAAPAAAKYPIHLATGHFGLVVGSAAMTWTWPTIAAWCAWQDGVGPRPPILDEAREKAPPEPAIGALGDADASDGAADRQERGTPRTTTDRLYDLATDVVDGLWNKMGEVGVEVGQIVDSIRWQLPRLAKMGSLTEASRVSFARVLSEQAAAIPDQVFFLWEGRAFTYAQANRRVTQLVGALAHCGVRRGRHVGILSANHPDYLSVVAALNRLGAVSVLLNAESRGASLAHALGAGEVDLLLVDAEHRAVAAEVFRGPTYGIGDDLEGLVTSGAAERAVPDAAELDRARGGELATLVLTSGTTGLPKAARITNLRWVSAGLGAAAHTALTSADTIYCCLPLYHATGMLVAVGGAVVGGARLALAPRFSASRFWTDVRNLGATVVFYVGELCRYLVNQPATPEDHLHPVRLFAGNGLQPDVWTRMLERFGAPHRLRILEFYSATEGTVVLVNTSGDKIGAIGREMTGVVKTAILRWDADANAIVRGADGRPVPVVGAEAGLLIARIQSASGAREWPGADVHPLAAFAGYTDPVATEAKVLRDVFAPGDAWFDTGDLVSRDADGDHFFVDRVGDTYRWKGENVSTELVARVVRALEGVAAAAVYGVRLPGREGRAGMAAIELVPYGTFDPEAAWDAVTRHLTPASRPRFVRVVAALPMTETHKVQKVRLQTEGADPGRVGDPLWWYDEAGRTYRPLTLERYVELVHG